MMIPVYSYRKKAKVRFFTAYAVSVLLLLVLFSSFLKPTAQMEGNLESHRTGNADHHSAIYQTLHQRMEKLDGVCVNVARNRSAKNLALLSAEENAFYASIDSIRKTFVSGSAPQKENEILAFLEAFKRTAEQHTNLARGITPQKEGNDVNTALTGKLVEKDQRITELEGQNKLLLQEVEAAKTALLNMSTVSSPVIQKPAGNNESEWKERYETMKTAHDRLRESHNKYATEVNDLKKSYKDLVDDNRRLLAQLQAARAGRN